MTIPNIGGSRISAKKMITALRYTAYFTLLLDEAASRIVVIFFLKFSLFPTLAYVGTLQCSFLHS
jgi:hypothetical protein